MGGVLLLVNRYLVLALTLLGPVIVNILLYYLLLDHTGAIVAVVVVILWGLLVFVTANTSPGYSFNEPHEQDVREIMCLHVDLAVSDSTL